MLTNKERFYNILKALKEDGLINIHFSFNTDIVNFKTKLKDKNIAVNINL